MAPTLSALISAICTILAIRISSAVPTGTQFTILTDRPGPRLVDEFLSVTIDAGLSGHWNAFDFSSTLVNTLAKGLSPPYLRYGGTNGDRTGYDTNSGNITSLSSSSSISMHSMPSDTAYTLNMTEFSELADFAQTNGWKLIFGLNAQERFANNTWNASNSRDLMMKIIESGRDELVIGYELGNEPDLYYRYTDLDFVNVTAQQMAADFVTLYQLIHDEVYKDSKYKPFIWGCDIAYKMDYFADFLQHSSASQVAGATWHQYYGNGAEWNLTDFISVSKLDSLIPLLNESLDIVQTHLAPQSYDILGETSSTYGGGTANLSSGFVAGFLWLDKLGLSSGLGLHLVARQDFCGGHYGLIGNGKDFEPNPDYWSSYLFKNLVGNTSLYVEGEFMDGRSIRTYAFCAKTKQQGSIFDYQSGDVTVMILNLQNNTVEIELNIQGEEYDEYLLTSYPNVITSRDIFLNGNVLKMVSEDTFPAIKPNTVNGGSTISMTALSYGFVVIRNGNVSVCR